MLESLSLSCFLYVGVLLNHAFPVWLITLCLVSLLTYLTYKTMNKGLRLHQAERSPSADKPELHLVQVHLCFQAKYPHAALREL